MSESDTFDDLPEGWARTTIGEIASPSKEKVEPNACPSARYLSLEHIESETGRILGSGHATDVNSTKAVFHAGDVLYGKLRPYLNKVTLPDFDGICSTDILVFPKTDWLISEYLRHFLSTRDVVQYANHNSSGVQLPRVSFTNLGELPFPLPPLAEQKLIVAKVETLLARVNAARQLLAKVPSLLKRFRQSVLAAACSGQLTEDWRSQNPESEPQSVEGEDGEFDLPEGWKWVRFKELMTSLRSGSNVPPKNEATGFPVLRSSSVRPGLVDLQDVRYLRSDESENEDNYLHESDLLFTRLSGSLEFVGNCARVPELNGQRVQYPDRLFCAKLKDSDQGPYFVCVFATPFIRKQLTEGAKSSAGHQRISMGNITNQLVPVPPLAEQHEIVRRVEALLARADRIEKRLATATRRVETLTQAILAQAFRGELVVTEAELARRDGRDYEPASVLLERIRKEKTHTSSNRSRKKPNK